MSERDKQEHKGFLGRIAGVGCEPLLSTDFNDFQISMIWPAVLYVFRHGRRRGRGNWLEVFGQGQGRGSSARPTPRQVAATLLTLEDDIEGFSTHPAGTDILADWLAAGILDTVRSSGDPDDRVIRIQPLHALCSWIDLPTEFSYLRGVPEFLVAALAGLQPNSGGPSRGPFQVKSKSDGNLLYRVFGHGLRIPNLDDRSQDTYDEATPLDPEVLLSVRLAQAMGHAPPLLKSGPPTFDLLNPRQLKRLREDFSILLRAYGHTAPPAVLVEFLGALTAASLTPFLLGHARAAIHLYETGEARQPIPQEAAIFLDCTGGRSAAVAEAAERCFLGHVELLHRYLRVHLGFRWLEKFLQEVPKSLKIKREEVPDRARDTVSYLRFLAKLRASPQTQMVAEGRLSELEERFQAADEPMGERVRALVAEEVEPDSKPFDRWISVLLALQKDLGHRFSKFHVGCTGGNTPFGLLALGRRREAHRYSLSDPLLEALVHVATVGRSRSLRARRPSIRDFIHDLQDHYGIYIHVLPPGLDPHGGPASLGEANLRSFKERLRMLGLFQAISDAEAMQRVHGRYPVKGEFEEEEPAE